MKKARNIIFSIIGILILAIIILYARDGRLSFENLKNDFLEALNLKQARIEERLNYNPITYEDFIEKLKSKGLVVGEPIDLGSNTLGAKIAVKFNVEGKNVYFYIIDWDDKDNDNMLLTKQNLEDRNEVYVEGKWYKAVVNETALITKYQDNSKADVIEKEFLNMVGMTYDEMVKEREDNSLNPAVTTIDKILDNFEQATK